VFDNSFTALDTIGKNGLFTAVAFRWVMKLKIIIPFVLVAGILNRVEAQTYDTNGDYVQTFAGSGFYGYVDGVGQLTMFHNPDAVVADSHGNLFVWDSNNGRIREIAPNTTVTTFAGGGSDNSGFGTNVSLPSINAVAIDTNNTIWFTAGSYSSTFFLYEITSDALVTRKSISTPGYLSYSSNPAGICVDSLGNIYISDSYNHQIYRYANGVISVFAGSGNQGYADGNGIFTAFNSPAALAADAANNIYVWDSGNYLIRKIDQNQNVTTFAGTYNGSYYGGANMDGSGTNASFSSINQMCFDHAGNLYLACGNCIRKIDAQTNVVTMAGSFTVTGYTNGAGNLARFNGAYGVCLSGGAIFVADSINQRIRDITFNPSTQPVLPASLHLSTYPGLQIIGTVGRTYQIQASPDMNTWNTAATVLLTSSPYLWIDQNSVSGNKFYRALLLP
jgi:hypothetical protein